MTRRLSNACADACELPLMKPIARLTRADARRVRVVFTDVDGTLTTGGKLLPSTYAALWRWRDEGRLLIVVTGRSAGWAEAFARTWPADAVIAENGGLTMVPREGGLDIRTALPRVRLDRERERMRAAARELERLVPGARLSYDSRFTEVDLAIDYNEENHLGDEAARQIEKFLRSKGFQAVRSSVHVNFWPGRFDKLSSCRKLAEELSVPLDECVYVGDSVNDEPMFRGFPLSVGVANVRDVLDRLRHPPRFVTRAREGKGFEELVRYLLAARA